MRLVNLEVLPHPELDLGLLELSLEAPLGTRTAPSEVAELLRGGGHAPMHSDDTVRAAIRDLLRGSGFKPTGRSKPSSEYLVRASAEGRLAPINALVDLGNAVSLHSGLPISVVDLDRAAAPLWVSAAAAGSRYEFNASGQEIDVANLLCLHDANGPCANAVKDAQRTKTDAATHRALVLVWGSTRLDGRTARTVGWLTELAQDSGFVTRDVDVARR